MAPEAIFRRRIMLKECKGLHKILDRTAAEAESNPRNPFALVQLCRRRLAGLRMQTFCCRIQY
jgi:hypothetical protein